MKKYKFCLFLLLGIMFIFSGCAGDGYLKTTRTEMELSNFYEQNYINYLSTFQNVENNTDIITTQEDKILFTNYNLTFYQGLMEERCLVSAVDLLTAINQIGGATRLEEKPKGVDSRTKIYEYSNVFSAELLTNKKTETIAGDYANKTAYVVVKSAKNDAEISTYLFYKNKNDIIDPSVLLADVDNAVLTCIFTLNKYDLQSKTYTLTYGKNGSKSGCEVRATFNQAKGYFVYEMKTFLGETNTVVNFKKSFYKYANSIVGVRELSSYKSGGETTLVVREQLIKPFYCRQKLGEVKTESNILSLETMQEEKLAKSNSSDQKGFILEQDSQEDMLEILCSKYGMA